MNDNGCTIHLDNMYRTCTCRHTLCRVCFVLHRYMEKSAALMEEKNETISTATTQSQSKILALEQDKARGRFFGRAYVVLSPELNSY